LEIGVSSVFALFGLYAFTAAFQGFLSSHLGWLQRLLVTGVSFLLLWPGEWVWNAVGLVMLLSLMNMHRFMPKKSVTETT
jgi:TRAP-type uncharacterized transport system fused permease subunit